MLTTLVNTQLYAVKELMGHKSIKTTERYSHHAPESLRHTVKVLDGYQQKTPGHNLATQRGQAVALTQ